MALTIRLKSCNNKDHHVEQNVLLHWLARVREMIPEGQKTSSPWVSAGVDDPAARRLGANFQNEKINFG